MRKSNYLAYLNEYQKSISPSKDPGYHQLLRTMKPIKQITKTFKSKSILNNKNKQQEIKNKQNLHPNLADQPKFHSVQNHCLNKKNAPHIDKNIQRKSLQNMQKLQNKNVKIRDSLPQFSISLTKCNFQPSHSNQNLYLIESGTQRQIIVCEKCAEKFSSKIKVSELYNKNSTPNFQYSYKQLIQIMNSHKLKNQKLNEVKKLLINQFKNDIKKVQQYYHNFIQTIIQAKEQVQLKILQINETNQKIVQNHIQQNTKIIGLLQKSITKMKQTCIDKQNTSELKNIMGQIKILEQKNINDSKLELFSTQIQISQTILQFFSRQFFKSKFHIQLSSNSKQNKIIGLQQISQQNSISEDAQDKTFEEKQYHIVNKGEINFQKLLPSELQKMPSDEELLLESYREQKQQISQQKNNQSQQGTKNNIKTQSTTNQIIEQKNKVQNTKNFLKQLHRQKKQMNDLLCDQQLNLSTSHPIHSKPRYSPFNRKKPEIKQTKKMTISEIDFDYTNSNQLKSNLSSLITHPSIIIAKNRNQNEISFELDQNIILQGNILDSDENQTENYDIISPAFKLI